MVDIVRPVSNLNNSFSGGKSQKRETLRRRRRVPILQAHEGTDSEKPQVVWHQQDPCVSDAHCCYRDFHRLLLGNSLRLVGDLKACGVVCRSD